MNSERPSFGAFDSGVGPAIVYFAFRAAAWLAEHVAVNLANKLAGLGAVLAYKFARKKRKIVTRNMARVVTGSPKGVEATTKAAFKSYARYWLETFRLGRYSRADLLKMVASDSMQNLEAALEKGNGVVIITAHFGFYDVGVAWVGAKGYPLTTVAEVLRPRKLFEWFAHIREERGMRVLPAKPGAEARKTLIETVEGGAGIALLSDRDLGRRGVWVEFFGERTTIPVGPAFVLARTGAALLSGAIWMIDDEGPGRYRIEFEPVPYELTGDERRDVETIAQRIANVIEGLVRRAPEQWHLFSTNWPSDEPHLPPRGTIGENEGLKEERSVEEAS